MVLRAISSDDDEDETTTHRSSSSSSYMATVPVKSQPLHNFSLSFKWGKNQMNNHRCRRHVDSTRDSSPPTTTDNRSSASEPDSDGGGGSESENRKLHVGSRSSATRNNNRFAISSCSLFEKSQQQKLQGQGVLERESNDVVVVDEARGEKVLIRKDEFGVGVEVGVEESVQKPWNLRPRRAITKAPIIEIGGASSKNGELHDTVVPAIPTTTDNLPKSLRLRGFAESQGTEKKEKKRQLWISLSRDEIEEDIFVMTGSKPARRPKKRPKNVQKQVDNVFPGLWLAGLTLDTYRVPDAPVKR